jgi:glutamate formiminotransferase
MLPLEAVPNISEGRDGAVVAAVGRAFASAGAHLLDTHWDADHHRSVFTLVGGDDALGDGLVAGVAAARDAVDLRLHEGIHPRVGAADVIPVVALSTADFARAETVALSAAERIGDELALPVFLYGSLADGVRPAFYRRGGPDELRRRMDAGEVAPAFGPPSLDPRAGAVLVGVRAPLLAFNVVLDASLEVAREVAVAVRASSGGLPGVQALALRLDDGTVQLSTNIVDLDATPPHMLVERAREETETRGGRIVDGELVGLVPAASVAAAAAAAGIARPVDADGLPSATALAAAAAALQLRRLDPDRVLEWHLRR